MGFEHSFFKVIRSSEKLEVPPAFAVAKRCILRDGINNMWRVEVAAEDDKWYFRKGWTDLFREKSLNVGDILLFEYMGDNSFRFKLFGEGAREPTVKEEELEFDESSNLGGGDQEEGEHQEMENSEDNDDDYVKEEEDDDNDYENDDDGDDDDDEGGYARKDKQIHISKKIKPEPHQSNTTIKEEELELDESNNLGGGEQEGEQQESEHSEDHDNDYVKEDEDDDDYEKDDDEEDDDDDDDYDDDDDDYEKYDDEEDDDGDDDDYEKEDDDDAGEYAQKDEQIHISKKIKPAHQSNTTIKEEELELDESNNLGGGEQEGEQQESEHSEDNDDDYVKEDEDDDKEEDDDDDDDDDNYEKDDDDDAGEYARKDEQIHISKKIKPEPHQSNTTIGAETLPSKRRYKKQNVPDCYGEEIFKSGLASRPNNPYFVSRSRILLRKNELYIPKDVIVDYHLNIPEKMYIVDDRGREWKTKIKQWKDGRVWCTKGWKSLRKVNNIKLDDICICEFRGCNTDMRLHVHVVDKLL